MPKVKGKGLENSLFEIFGTRLTLYVWAGIILDTVACVNHMQCPFWLCFSFFHLQKLTCFLGRFHLWIALNLAKMPLLIPHACPAFLKYALTRCYCLKKFKSKENSFGNHYVTISIAKILHTNTLYLNSTYLQQHIRSN